MTAAALSPVVRRPGPVWRIVRLLAVKPAVFFGIPWLIMGAAWAVTMVIALLLHASGVPMGGAQTGFRYSWAVLSPQWYLVVVGVQAVAYTFSFALGFGSTRRDFWLGMSAMFLFVSAEMAAAIATLVQIEKATHGWFIGAGMFDALWYGQNGWAFDFYTTFALQLAVLFLGAGSTAVFMRWRMSGMLVFAGSVVAILLIAAAILTWTSSWVAFGAWLAAIGVGGLFTVILALAAVFGVAGFVVIRGATPR
ncbi:hypothetical protein [Microbacterium mangrovi]|uniref:hypothetical protein n=1 Tax=Microbacterium mangrovi TaxID=1348253 RepID=UPI00068E3515|nr:hypothetical protein [Microbacterium mangrovi]